MISALLLALAPTSPAPATTVNGVAMIGSKPARSAVVWLSDGTKPKPVKASIVQKDKRFQPHILAVPMGSTVSFPNRDDLFHNVFAEYDAKKFDLGQYPKGQTRDVTFPKPGVVSVLCNVHSEMSAYIMVVDSPYYTVTDGNGKFTIKNVPSGTYTAHAWHESENKTDEKVDVSGSSKSLTLSLKR